MGRAKLNDPPIVRALATALLGIGTSAKLPPTCQSKVALRKTMDMRYEELGDRGEMLRGAKAIIFPRGDINWLNGIYTVEFDEEGKGMDVIHRPATKRVELKVEVVVDASFDFVMDWDDMGAPLEKGLTRYKLKGQFKPPEGPHRKPMWLGQAQKLVQMAKLVDEEVQKATMNTLMEREQESKASFTTPLKEANTKATARARDALPAKKNETSKSRRVSWGV